MKSCWFVFIISGLTGCSATAPSDPDEKFAEQVQADVRHSLKDPDSAQFEDIKAFAKEKVACGKVNAKNSYGGYVGMDDFSYYVDQVHLQSDDMHKYIVGSGKCMIVTAKRAIAEVKSGELPTADKEKLIGMYQKNISNI